MIEKSTEQKVLGAFLQNPSKEFYLRELSRLLKLSMPTIIGVTDILAKKRLIIKTKRKALTNVIANPENPVFTRIKRVHNLEQIYLSGIVDYLSRAYGYPKNIILFGSFSRGEDVENSDIDIAVVTNKKLRLDMSEYEKALKKEINVHEVNLHKLSEEFKSNLANGIVFEGSW